MVWMKVRRTLRRVIWATVATLVAVLASMPVWFPWVLGSVLHRQGARYEFYERMGYRRLVIHHLQVRAGDIELTAERVETLLPAAWLWRHCLGRDGGPALVVAENWEVRPATGVRPSQAGSVAAILNRIDSGLPRVRTWLPSARLTGGTVVLQDQTLKVAWLEWDGRKVRAEADCVTLGQAVAAELDLGAAGPWQLTAAARPAGVAVQARIFRETSAWKMGGEILWEDNQAEFGLTFVDGRWPPVQARLEAAGVRVPARLLGLEPYSALTGSIHLAWADDQFRLQATADAEPLIPAAPRAHLELAACGDAGQATVETLDVNMPWLQAELSDAVHLEFGGQRWLARPATLRFRCDLERLPLARVRGRLAGTARIEPSTQKVPRVVVEAAGAGVFACDTEIETCRLQAAMEWPRVEVLSAEISLPDHSAVTAAGTVDVTSGAVADGSWSVHGPLVRRVLPTNCRIDTFEAHGTCHGQWTNLAHAGELTATGVQVPYSAGLQVQARWQGEGPVLSEVAVQVVGKDVTLEARGAAQWGPEPAIQVDQGVYRRDGREVVRLTTPAQVVIGPSRSVSVQGLHLAGDGRMLSLAGVLGWPQQGWVQAKAHGIRLRDLEGLMAEPIPDATLDELDVDASWDKGPARLAATVRAEAVGEDGRCASIRVEVTADEKGLSLETLAVRAEDFEAVARRGHVPVAIVPARWPRPWQAVVGQGLQLEARVTPEALLGQRWLERSGVKVVSPQLQVTLSGTLEEPHGRVEASAQQIDLGRWIGHPNGPALENVHLDAEVDRQGVTLRTLSLEVEGQPVRASGVCPVPSGYWDDLLSQPRLPDWRAACGRLTIDQAHIAAFTRPATALLLGQGRLSVDATLQAGGHVEGTLTISDAATRPFGSLPSVRDIRAEVRLEDRLARLENGTATVGGQPVTLSGWARLSDANQPQIELTLKGQNVPLVRQAGLVLRSDLDVQWVQSGDQPALLTGKMVVRDSLMVREVKWLSPSGTARPEDRPPYFSIANKPFADWRLALHLQGDRCMRVRTPWFSGEVSGDFRLQGTLGEPVSTGEARINTGLVRFPFADFTVDQGRVELTAANPYEPTLDLTATSRCYGYTLKLSVRGPVVQPVMSFSSTPAASSEEILSLVTAGHLPKGGTPISPRQRAGVVAGFFARDLLRQASAEEDTLDRLSVRTGEEISETGQPTQTIEYRLDDRWSVFGEYDRFNQFNAGLKLRLYSK